ncbi:beta-ketoacyl synthase N-terminal-like domain-containing protein [Streptomyces sp. Je 1-369]|uniref:beta-ketoacyl synthase N-terminal-like domain-containing protein n=1 Tax=Streptomyces sp. Je 1-369 TaxID=2966192 RepID=UPI002285C376|nr:beta-ketoacyl synthase N-terminal-like domain-containing protein [Streptomyces sp. Je 1-369]WAL97005.1 KR domain-containing protein [Streptomyces sp. Je 1-369]
MSDAEETGPPVRPNDVAVIGMSGRFPGAADLDRFWSRLRAGDDLLTTFTDEQLAAAGAPEKVLRDPCFVKRAAVLPDAFGFDHEFFGYTRREAKLLDPQQRILLEVAWELLETVGYSGGADDQAIGVFAGASMNTYLTNVVARSCDPLGYDGTELMIANDKDYLTTRISYKLGLTGPSINVQTACSTSLVAVHLAVQSLLTGECDIALAGGVSVIANNYPGYVFSEGMILSPDGRCRPFDADGAGTTFGDGVGLVALKRLAEAIEDGDRILAVVKGSAINNDGSDKIGYTAPSIGGQRAVITEAQAVAGVDSDTVTYVEAHGTATALGDPIEFAALSEAFVDGGARPGRCALGSVKANVGHLAAAAGITGFIKTVLALHHREIPGHPGFTRPNPRIDLDGSPFHINTSSAAWPSGETPRRAGVSSFGIGGTNAHVVLEEAPAPPGTPQPAVAPQLLAVSARSGTALRELTARLADALEGPDAPDLADAAYTLRRGRRAFPHRCAVVADDRATAAARLRALADGQTAGPPPEGTAPAVSFLFGEVPADEFRTLAARLPAVADLVERNFPPSGTADDDPVAARVTATQALATLWAESGVRPAAVGGAGAGEVLAACFAGALSPSDAMALLSWRAGRLDRAPEIRPRVPDIPVLSAVVGGELPQARALDPQHWTRDVWEGDRPAEAFSGRSGDGAAVLAIGTPPDALPKDSVLGADAALPPVERLLTAAARLWTAGVPVDWSDWSGGAGRRVPLPAHPLNRTFLRIEPPAATGTREPVRVQGPAPLLYTQSWQRLDPVTDAHARSTQPAGPWLLFADSGGVCDALADALRGRGASVVVVRHGDAFGRTEDGSFVVDPADAGDFERLFAAIAADGQAPERVMHFWSLDIASGRSTLAGLDRACDLGLFSVLDIAVHLTRGRGGADAHLTVVARDVHDITGGESVAPAAAMTDAVLGVLSREFAGLRCRSIDIGTDTGTDLRAGLRTPEALLAEAAAPTAAPVAFRHGRRWTRRFVPVTSAAGREEPSGRLRPGGVYLVTGGLGELGLLLADRLSRAVGAVLVLADRTPLPRPDEFDRWVAQHGPADPVSRKIEAVRAVERLGGTVTTASVDVTDVRAMRELVDATRLRFGRIDGWFHCAGAPRAGGGLGNARTDRGAWREHLAPAVRGALVLDEIFRDAPADFGVMMSSPASVPGGTGGAVHAAVDRFLDAQVSAADGLAGVSWRSSLPPEQAADVLDLVLGSGLPSRLTVSATDLERHVQVREQEQVREQVQEQGVRPEPVSPAPVVPARRPSGDELKATLAELWSEVLRTEVDRYDLSLFDLGGDELLAVRLARRIERELGVPLTGIDLLTHPTVDLLAARLDPERTTEPSRRRPGRRTGTT